MSSRKRRWNNYLILAVIVFIILLNSPQLIKNYLISSDNDDATSTSTLLDPYHQILSIHTPSWSLIRHKEGHWGNDLNLSVTPEALVERWQSLKGTNIDKQTFRSLKPKLKEPETIEVWYADKEEPQRITYYRLPTFWLFSNWKSQWIAVSVGQDYLFPQPTSSD